MESNYDENLNENIFFQSLQNDQPELFLKATIEGWIICVPRAGTFPKYALTPNDFFSHILVPSDELPETHFRTLNNKDIRIYNRVISIEPYDISSPISTHILFEETYYTEDLLKYKVLCIEDPLEQYSDGIKSESGIVTINTLRDCIDLLWTESSKDVLEKIDDSITTFLSQNDQLEFKTLQLQKDLVGSLYTLCLQIALKDSRLKDKTSLSKHLLENVKVSVETYMHRGIYSKLIKGITACTAYDDANFNKIVRNLSDIQLRDLDINPEFQAAIPKARTELSSIERYSTVIGKIGCLKRTVMAISNPNNNEKGTAVAADDLLPMFVFLIIKSGLANWVAHLTYLKEFCYSSCNYHADQYSFLVTSLEAAIEHIRNGLLVGPAEPESQINYDIDTFPLEISERDEESKVESPNTLTHLLELAKNGDSEGVTAILRQEESKGVFNFDTQNMCHPLCSCDKCEREMSIKLCNTAPTVNSCDDKGITVLHVAAMYGRPKVVDLLLSLGADSNKSDYKGSTPLHYAASRGHQNALLLLAHGGATLGFPDNEGNIPLHLAAQNGHEGCVKGLLYFAEHVGLKFDVNWTNHQGETALHYAARWGYESIVTILLEYGANPSIENKRKLTPLDYAHNMHISTLLWKRNSKRTITLLHPVVKNDIKVAAASKVALDLCDDSKSEDDSRRRSLSGIRPKSTEEMRRIERVLRAITHGDTRLACFYMGLEPSSHFMSGVASSCHPLCQCKNKEENSNLLGDSKVNDVMNINVCNSDGLTPLHVAAMCGRFELVEMLIEAGADLNLQTRTTLMTPLHLACQNERIKVATRLLDSNECDINCQDVRGCTALHYACIVCNAKLVEVLLKYKPRIGIRNAEGKTPLERAKETMSVSIITMLCKYVTES